MNVAKYRQEWLAEADHLRAKATELGVEVLTADADTGTVRLRVDRTANGTFIFDGLQSAWCWITGAMWARKKAA